jgi:hypothetical protein
MDISWKATPRSFAHRHRLPPAGARLWRNNLRRSGDPQRILDAVRKVIALSGVIEGKNRRALGSTVLDGSVQCQDTISLLVSAIRKVRNLSPPSPSRSSCASRTSRDHARSVTGTTPADSAYGSGEFRRH